MVCIMALAPRRRRFNEAAAYLPRKLGGLLDGAAKIVELQ